MRRWVLATVVMAAVLGSFSAPRVVAVEPFAGLVSQRLMVEDWRCHRDGGYWVAAGEVTNTGDRRIEDLAVSVTFRGEQGRFVKSDEALVDYQPLLPGQTTPFEVMARHNPAIAKCDIAFKKLYGEKIDHTTRQREQYWQRITIRGMQRELKALGYAVGPVDGRVGPKTRSAVRAFQEDRGYTVDGVVDLQLARRLDRASG